MLGIQDKMPFGTPAIPQPRAEVCIPIVISILTLEAAVMARMVGSLPLTQATWMHFLVFLASTRPSPSCCGPLGE